MKTPKKSDQGCDDLPGARVRDVHERSLPRADDVRRFHLVTVAVELEQRPLLVPIEGATDATAAESAVLARPDPHVTGGPDRVDDVGEQRIALVDVAIRHEELRD